MAALLLVNAGQVVLPEGSRRIQKVSGKNTSKKEILLLSGGQDVVPTYNSKKRYKKRKREAKRNKNQVWFKSPCPL
jgi:hypothetical protein